MKITKEKLIRLGDSFLKQRGEKDRTILCAYLTGSMLRDDPFISETTDVDIIMVHSGLEKAYREITPVSDDVTLDIYHYPTEYFSNTRNLRVDPWLGSSLCFDPIVLYGKGHWFEFILASTESTFFVPENVIERSKVFMTQAQKYYAEMKRLAGKQTEISYVFRYLLAIEHAVNAVACLGDKPITMRRFIRDMQSRCEVLENTAVPSQVLRMVQGPVQSYDTYARAWKYYLEYFSSYTRPDFFSEYAAARLPYYEIAAESMWRSHLPSGIWVMLYSWTQIMNAMQVEQNEWYHQFVSDLCISPEYADRRLADVDRLLEFCEDAIEKWGKSKGVDPQIDIYLDA